MAAHLHFEEISITGYKNYASRSFRFEERIVGICGLNGKGKTNLLDAINYLCFTKSYFTRLESLNVNFDNDGFRLEGIAKNEHESSQGIVCIYRPGGKKEFLLDEIPYEKFSHHIGKFPCIFIAPDDIALVTGGSEERRKFLDTLLSQLDDEYLDQLILYNKLLADRNGLLKYEVQQNRREEILLNTLDEQLAHPGNFLFNARKEFVHKLFPLIQSFYKHISGGTEKIEMRYESQLHDGHFGQLLHANREKDRQLQRTGTGIHKDDLLFEIHKNLFKNIASQGQRKSLLFACRLAAFEMLKIEKGFAPLLLLDDIFEKLDEKRMHNLLEFICLQNEGQVFITDTDASRLKKAINQFNQPVQIILLN